MTKTLTLRSLDIPSLHKFGIGFDSMFDDLMRVSQSQNTNYPPHNVIKKTEDAVTIEVAVAGFSEGEISLNVERNVLSVSGAKVDILPEENDTSTVYLHRGLSQRDFKLQFNLAEHVEVIDAWNKDGILYIDLERKVPEEQKPKSIAITYTK